MIHGALADRRKSVKTRWRDLPSTPREVLLPDSTLDDITPDTDCLKAIEVIKIVLEIEFVEPQRRDEGSVIRREMG